MNKKSITQSLGQQIRKRRLELGWSQRELAERINKTDRTASRTLVCKWEAGHGLQTLGVLQNIANVLDITFCIKIYPNK